MNPPIQENPDSPVWARDTAFPVAPDGWGWLDNRGKSHSVESLEKLESAIRDDRDGSLDLIWLPGHERMFLPEEHPAMGDALRVARERWTRDDVDEANHRLRWFGIVLGGLGAYTFLGGWILAGRMAAQSGNPVGTLEKVTFAAKAMLNSTQCGLALLMFIIFAFIPWWQARKRRAELGNWNESGIADIAPTIRFETWLARQKAPFTRALLVLVGVVGMAQIFSAVKLRSIMAVFSEWGGIKEAGLDKPLYFGGEWWRLFTAPLLHGNLVHFLMNAAAFAYLGKRVEVFARWPHLPLVFLFAACMGGEASARFISAPSVGASGGLMGWLGFLLVFETLHKPLVPRRARRRLAAGVFLTALIGIIGYRFIDNAAHAGGLLAGMLYAAIVFPASSSPHRPRSTITDRVAGAAALLVIVAAAGMAVVKILAG